MSPRRWSPILLLLVCAATPSRATTVPDLIHSMEGEEDAVAPLLLRMAGDPLYQSRVLERAGASQRALTDSLVSFLRQTEPAVRAQLPQMYEVRDGGPAVDERPPAWADVRLSGVRLFLAIALDDQRRLDARLRDALEADISAMGRPRPAAVGGLVLQVEAWWIERGDDPQYTHDRSRIPDLAPWLEGLELPAGDPASWGGARMLVDLADRPLAKRMLLQRLEPDTHAHVAAECMVALRWSTDDLDSLGVAPTAWDPALGRITGHRAPDLWREALDVLARVLPVGASGADDEAELRDRLSWWRRGRFEARYWRDPREAPDLAPWLAGADRPPGEGGIDAAAFVRNLYVATGFRDLLLDRVDAAHAPLVAELVSFLSLDEEQARSAGFELFLVLRDLRTDEQLRILGIPWEEMRAFVREVLGHVVRATGGTPPARDGDTDWIVWWREHFEEDRWYRDPAGVRPRVPALSLEPERGRID